jgi:hypothetical protein
MMRKRWRLTEVGYSYAKALAVHIARYEQKYTGKLSTCECQETFGSWVSIQKQTRVKVREYIVAGL